MTPSFVHDAIRSAARRLGLYEPLRDGKDRIFRTLRDSPPVIRWGLKRLLDFPKPNVERLSLEFDEERLWEQITSRVAETARRDPEFHPSTSSPFNLRTLYVLCRILRPAWVVETGVASGASSWVLLTALAKNGSGGLRSIDLPPAQWDPAMSAYKKIDHVSLPAHRQPGWLVPEPLRDRWQLVLGDAKAELPKLLAGLGQIDLFYHDAEHTREAMLREFRAAWAHLASRGALTSDDVGWNTAFDEFCAEVRPKNAGRWFSFGLVIKP